MYYNASADNKIFMAILGRSGLTWVQSKAIWMNEHKHKRKTQVCCNCWDKFADYRIVWKSANQKWYTTYHCVICIISHVEDYLEHMLSWIGTQKPLDHQALAQAVLLSGSVEPAEDHWPSYDFKEIAKNYLKSLMNQEEMEKEAEKTLDDILQDEILKILKDKAVVEYEELKKLVKKNSFAQPETDDVIVDALTELMSEGKIYEPEANLFKLIA